MRGVDERLARQRAATYRYWREDVSCRPGGDWAAFGGVAAHTTGLPPRHWNGAFLTAPTDLDVVLPQVAAWFAERDKPWGLLIPAETAVEPPGLEHALDQPVMLRDLADLPPVEGRVFRQDGSAADVAVVQAEAFHVPYDLVLAFVTPTLGQDARPPQVTITSYDGAEPTGCANVAFLDGVAAVHGVGVREQWRHRGLGRALTLECLHLAVAAGCDLAYLNPSPMAHGVYASLGFRDALPFRIWVPPDGS
jgi:GNAT superfamily N-acetyltransferase